MPKDRANERNKFVRSIRIARSFLAALLMALPVAPIGAATKHTVTFRHIDAHTDPEIVRFADAFIRTRIREDKVLMPDWWIEEGPKAQPIELVEYLEVDLRGDGTRQLFLQLGTIAYCGTAGCETYVFRRTPAGFEQICSDNMWEDLVILRQKENGYHLVDEGEAIIHWLDHPDRNGEICDTKGKPGYQ